MTLSNLPPGCSSPDGGLDHAMEKASEELLEAVSSIELAAVLTTLAPLIEKALNNAFAAGKAEGRWETLMEQETVKKENKS